jgi:ABC-type Fe3+-hydroxamate transport system substrate-binding protein
MRFTDQMGRQIELPALPERIISLVPSQTELLADLGLSDKLVGITKFCIHPPGLKEHCRIIGGTKQVHFDRIHALKPDLIIGNKEENEKQFIEELSKDYPVWMSDIQTYPDALEMIRQVGEITGTAGRAEVLISEIEAGFSDLQGVEESLSVAYLIWQKPFMGAGNNTFINEMLMRLGFQNVLSGLDGRYPEFSIKELRSLTPEVVLLSSEPYPFGEKHIEYFRANLPGVRVLLVDGEMFSWYGSRLRHSPNYFRELLAALDR